MLDRGRIIAQNRQPDGDTDASVASVAFEKTCHDRLFHEAAEAQTIP
jgi:hypothetical protein